MYLLSCDHCISHGVLLLLLHVIETQPKLGGTKEECPWNVHETRKGSWATGSLGRESNQDCLSSLPSFLQTASSMWQETWPPPAPEPVALATREINHFLQPQLANIPGRGSNGQGHRWVICHLSHVQLQSGEQGTWLGSEMLEEISRGGRHHIQKGEVLS